MNERNAPLDLNALRRRLADAGERSIWRSLEELEDPRDASATAMREFPDGAWRLSEGPSRRQFLTLLGGSLALAAGVGGCTDRPDNEKIVPYVRQPEQVVPGNPLTFATTMPVSGFGRGVLVESHEGRPTKIEGNPDHSASLGGSDVFMQASILQLYDPDRSPTVMRAGQPSHWGAFADTLRRCIDGSRATGGQGVSILTGVITSPTIAARMKELKRQFPELAWHRYDPTARCNTAAGALAAFGRPVNTIYQLEHAHVIVSLDSDFLIDEPLSLRYARHFANGRRIRRDATRMNRLYAAEATLTITGSMADHRLAIRSDMIERVARALAARVGVAGLSPQGSLNEEAEQFVAAAAGDLKANAGACVVIAGESQPPAVHALAHAMNQALGNIGKTVIYTDPVEVEPVDVNESLRSLVAAIEAGQIHTLLIAGVNPVHTSPADIPFRAALEALTKGSNFTAHLGLYDNETAFSCHWHVPEAHYLESWGDVRAGDGTASIVQPLIEPLYGGRSIHDLLGLLLGESAVSSYETVRAYWRQWLGNQAVDFEEWWARALRRGVIEGTAATPIQLGPAKVPPNRVEQMGRAMELVIRPDPCVGDGSFANLPWLQELPKPFTKLVWDNAALLSPRTAERLGAGDGDVVRLSIDGRSVDAAAMIVPGLADDSVTVHLGYGRTRAGGVGTTGAGEWARRGFNAYALRNSRSPWGAQGLVVAKTGARWKLVTTRSHHGMAALKGIDHDKLAAERLKPDVVVTPEAARDEIDLRNRKLVRVVRLTQYRLNPNVAKELGGDEQKRPVLSLYPGWDYSKGPQWGMSIDLQTCIGCNACVIACQAENNIPTVGKEEVSRQREMHWIRIDSYFAGGVDRPRVYHQPVPCMHCENAPCEYVCPTGATTHSTQGLNEMTYNRCIGTRYCSNNCPYKVRRFNFFNYGYESSQGSTQLQKNPEVTVRTRGVMEKCTYCVQRINRTRIEVEKTIVDLSERARRAANDEERKCLLEQARTRRFEMFEGLQTACQQACPTRAIIFGDIREPRSQVAMLKAQPHDYTLLDELTTRPRTSYLARVLNPGDAKDGGAA